MHAIENKITHSQGINKDAPDKKAFFQPKLTINAPGDRYEQEADRMANHIMRMPAGDQPFFKASQLSISGLQLKCKDCEDEEKLQRRENSSQATEASSEVGSYIASLSSKGSPLTRHARNFFEPRFGQDFSNVRIHNDDRAAKSAQSVNALAYTVGNNIVFNQTQFLPESDSGKKLLAHELTHVVQQNGNVNTSLIQKQPVNTNKDPASGIENDPETFSIEAGKHYLLLERNRVEEHLFSTNCSIQGHMRECDLLSNNGIKLKVIWEMDTNRVIVKSCIDNSCLACGYSYTVDNNNILVLDKIKCWPIAGI